LSTICKLAFRAPVETVLPITEAFLSKDGLSFRRTETEWPESMKGEAFIIERKFPSILSVKQVTTDVTEIYYNSFARLEDFASHLSSVLGTNVVVNIYQSVSTASYWALYSKGRMVRSIEAGEGTVDEHSGDMLPFEGSQPGRVCENDGDSFVRFDFHEQDWYNQEVGVPVKVYQNFGPGCTNFIITDGLSAGPKRTIPRRPWWRFW